MIDLFRYRIIDLSHELRPGERRRDGRYLHGDPLHERPVEVQDTRPVSCRRRITWDGAGGFTGLQRWMVIRQGKSLFPSTGQWLCPLLIPALAARKDDV